MKKGKELLGGNLLSLEYNKKMSKLLDHGQTYSADLGDGTGELGIT